MLIVLTLVTVVFVSSMVGTIFYYNNELDKRNSEVVLLNAQISKLSIQISEFENQITYLTSQVSNLTSANLVTALGITEVNKDTSKVPRSYNRLYIDGTITNAGTSTAFNVGLHVAAYTVDGTLEINMTIPLTKGEIGADAATNSYVLSFDPYVPINESSMKLGVLVSGQIAQVQFNIYHQGVVCNWTATAVYSNTI